MDIIIIEDLKKIRETLIALINTKYNDVRILAQTDSVAEAYDLVQNLKPQLLLLDIDLVDGNGFDLLNKLPHKNFKTIFITGNSTRALEAIKHDAVDYVVKPINPDEFYAAIEKAKKILEKDGLNNTLQFVSTNLKALKPQKRLTLKTATSIHSVNITDIIRCESEGKYTTFYLANTKKIVMSTPIKEYEEQLAEFGFYRIHQSHIINTTFFESVLKNLENTVLLTNGEKLPLATRKKQEFLQYIETNL